MAGFRIDLPRAQVLSLTGVEPGAKLYVYQNGTTTPISLYSDRACTASETNPVVADSAGRLNLPYTTYGGLMTLVLKHVNATTLVETTQWTENDQSGFYDRDTPWVDVASATTTDIGAINSDKIRITGTTAITSLGSAAAGVRKTLLFAGALTLTYNATSLILPSAASIQTVAGGSAEAISEGSGNWRVINYYDTGAYQPLDAGLTAIAAASGAVATVAALAPMGGGISYGHLYGLETSNNASDPTNDIDIALGFAVDSTRATGMELTAGITKRLDAAWAVGSGNGGLDQGSIANATYHLHLIKRPDTAVVDAIYSLSHDHPMTATMTVASPCVVTVGAAGDGHGLVAGSPFKFSTTGALPTGVTAGTQYFVIATGLTETAFQFSATNGGAAINSSGSQSGVHACLPGPLLPTGYSYFRRVASVIRASAALLKYRQLGDVFLHNNASTLGVVDWNATSVGTSAVTRTVSTPVGILADAIVQLYCNNAATTYTILTPLYGPDMDPLTVGIASPFFMYTPGGTSSSDQGLIRTNRQSQIRSRASASGASNTQIGATLGWVDTRGRLAA